MAVKITWLGHASIKIEHGQKIIYIDPWKVKGPKADIILITHSHFDHYSARRFVGNRNGGIEKGKGQKQRKTCEWSVQNTCDYFNVPLQEC